MLTQAPVRFDVSNFVGAVKLIDPRLLQDNMATEAINCELEAGTIASIKAPSSAGSTSSSNGTLFIDQGTIYGFPGDCDVVASPVGDSVGRFYYTGNGKPKKTNRSMYPGSRALGITPPSLPISASGDNLFGETVVATVSYIYTYVTEWGEESAPSPPSAVFELYDKIDVDLSGIQVPSFTDQVVTKKRIYRLASGTQGADYQFLAEIAAGVSTYRDETATADLGEVCPTQTWIGPPDDLKGLTYLGNGYMAGFKANEVYISAPFAPYAYPLANMFSFDSEVVGLGVFGQTTIVCTKDKIGMLYGVDPQSMTQDVLPESYPCISKASIVSMTDCVIFASKRGLVHCSSQGVNLLTRDIWSESDWAALQPQNLIGVAYNGRYYGFFKNTAKGFILDFRSFGGDKYPTIVELDLSGFLTGGIISAAIDGSNNRLYILCPGHIYQYAGSNTNLQYTWASKTFIVDQHCNLGAAKVSISGTGAFYYNGGQVTQHELNNTAIFRLPAGTKSEEMSFKIVGTGEVRHVVLADSIRLINGRES